MIHRHTYRFRFRIIISLILLLTSLNSSRAYAGSERVAVVDHGWHTGIIVPAKAAERAMPFLRDRFVTPRYYEFGWGDAGFYQAEDIDLWLALRALFSSDASVVHVVRVTDEPVEFFPYSDVTEFDMPAQELQTMLAFISEAFALQQGQVEWLRIGLYGDSQFFHSEHRYHLLYTCNTWVAEALSRAGVDIDPDWTWFSSQVMSAVEDHPSEAAALRVTD